jgi:hypothetical protein
MPDDLVELLNTASQPRDHPVAVALLLSKAVFSSRKEKFWVARRMFHGMLKGIFGY